MTTDKKPYTIWQDPVGLEPDGTISMNTGDRMSAETEPYREKLRLAMKDAEHGYEEAVECPPLDDFAGRIAWWKEMERRAAEAVAAQVLRDVIALLEPGNGETYVFPGLVIERFARDRGIDLDREEIT